MLLNEFALSHYLIGNGFLKPAQIVENHVWITRDFSRNRNFKVFIDDGKGFLVKQPKLSFYQKKSALKREADIYWLVSNDADFAGMKNFIPQFFHYDVEVQVLITGLIEPAANLHDYHASTNEYPELIATRQAEILAALHQITVEKIKNKKSFALFPKKSNWLFNIESEDEWWSGNKSDAELQLQELVKSNVDFMQCINTAKKKWETKCLLHNDIRWTNFLIHDNNVSQIKLIDWELADFGDPCWDIAGILQSYFSYWILQHEANPFQLLKMKPAIEAFINNYVELMKIPKAQIEAMFIKSVEFTGVRMVQNSIEQVLFHKVLSRNSVQVLQFALNILKNPEQAFNDFLKSKKISA